MAGAEASEDRSADFFDTNGVAADGCEEPCGAVENGVCSTCSSAKVCSSVTCSANFVDTNGEATDGCEAPCSAVDIGVCSTCPFAVVCRSVTCNSNFFDTNADAEASQQLLKHPKIVADAEAS